MYLSHSCREYWYLLREQLMKITFLNPTPRDFITAAPTSTWLYHPCTNLHITFGVRMYDVLLIDHRWWCIAEDFWIVCMNYRSVSNDKLPHGSPKCSMTELMWEQQYILRIAFFITGDLSPTSSALTNSLSTQNYINHCGRVGVTVGKHRSS